MPWFRWKKRREAAPAEAAAPQAPEEERPAARGPAAEAERKPARRRGSRGGRGRKKKTDAPAGQAAAPPAAKSGERKPKADRKPGDSGWSRERKRAPAKRPASPPRPPLPDVKKEILVSVEVLEQTVAVLEDGKPAEVYLGRPDHRTVAGNIYKGVVDNVLPGMEASFVDIGLGKNGFLYVDEIVVPELEGKRHGKRIQELISRGQEVLVQAVKDPMGTKGARLTTEVSLPGRFLVYTPYGDGIGVSRRLDDDERERLKKICKALELPEGGLIVRTAAEGATEEELAGDLKLLLGLWHQIRARAERTKAPALVHQEADLPLRIVRDLFIRDFHRVVVDHERTYRKIVGYLKRTSPELAARVERYAGKEALLEKSGVREAVLSTLSRRVDLPSGGYLIFDYAEAFTVIDVNTGRFVGGRGKSSQGRLEDTITKNNLEAVKEVVRQLRLRDVGGIIVIDFIDMANPKNRQLVESALDAELARDRTKTYVVEISPLGLVEMTRQNVTDGPREILTVKCPTCAGDGIVVSAETQAVEAERRLRRHAASSKAEAFLVELHTDVAAILAGPGGSRLEELEKETGKRFSFKTKKSFRLDRFQVVAEGKAAKIDPDAFKVSRGQVLEVSLEKAPRNAERDAIARLDGYVVTVKGGAGKVGETVKIRIDQAGRASAVAVLADGSAPPELEPAQAVPDEEGEEQKPKRKTRRGTRGGRGRKRKITAAPDATAADGAPEPTPEPEPEAAAAEAPEAEAAPETGAPKPPRRRRTAKKPAEADPAAEEAREETPSADAAADEAGAAEAGTEEKPRKKTRRGTRGGRRRRKKPQPDASEPIATAEEGG
ncbi:MAG TPA: Rne/Rng family ribonuclease [Gaiellaceae bacterium]|nr:Rne/Rng family ribonuclease [Gaiellaceae bacterium]